MSLKNNLINLFKGKYSVQDVWCYIQGSVRYKLFYSSWKWLIRKHIREQILYRISVMKKECYDNGECVKCGCATTALQMCNKVCEGNCYHIMKSKKDWEIFKSI